MAWPVKGKACHAARFIRMRLARLCVFFSCAEAMNMDSISSTALAWVCVEYLIDGLSVQSRTS